MYTLLVISLIISPLWTTGVTLGVGPGLYALMQRLEGEYRTFALQALRYSNYDYNAIMDCSPFQCELGVTQVHPVGENMPGHIGSGMPNS